MHVPRHNFEVTEDERAVIEAALREWNPVNSSDEKVRRAQREKSLIAKDLANRFRTLGVI